MQSAQKYILKTGLSNFIITTGALAHKSK